MRCRFVRRWFRGRTTCARCDVEFRPHPHSTLAEKRDSATSKTPVKHSSAGQVAVPKDVRKPEPRPEEKVTNVAGCVFSWCWFTHCECYCTCIMVTLDF